MHRSSRLMIALFVLGSVACNQTKAAPPRTAAPDVSSNTVAVSPEAAPRASSSAAIPFAGSSESERYIVPAARGAKFYEGHYDDAADYFASTESDVSALEAHLAGFLRASSDSRARGLAGSLGKYRRQFVGVVVNGKRLIFANFFCSDEPATTPVIVDDGGDCYFNLFYDPKIGAFSKLSVNGDA